MCILHNWILSQQVPFHIHNINKNAKTKKLVFFCSLCISWIKKKTKMTRWKEPTNPLKHALKKFFFSQPVRLLSNVPLKKNNNWLKHAAVRLWHHFWIRCPSSVLSCPGHKPIEVLCVAQKNTAGTPGEFLPGFTEQVQCFTSRLTGANRFHLRRVLWRRHPLFLPAPETPNP